MAIYPGERFNSITHLVAAVFAVMGLGALLTLGLQSGSQLVLFSYAVYGTTLVLLFTMSTLYHSFRLPKLKSLFKLFDHVAIYILIAGSYTPFMLVGANDSTSRMVLALVWGLAVCGILSEIFLKGRAVKIVQVMLYLAMGWACSIDLQGMEKSLGPDSYFWLVAGGIAYTSGVVFYVIDKLNWLNHAHGIWHMFVLTGAVAHFVAVVGLA